MDNRISPCMGCTRVKDPRDCENKNCMLWQKWFLHRWESLRKAFLVQMHTAPRETAGVPIGGRRYASPHQVRAYLHADPCSGCVCDKDLCHEPCPSRRSWEMARRDVFL